MNANPINVRKGITPVVAIVMLLMLTIVVAGGVFAFINTFMDEQEEELMEADAVDVDLSSVTCDSDSDEIDFTVTNDGDANIDLETVDFFVTDVSDGSLVDEPFALSPDDPDELTVDERHWSDTIDSDDWDGELEAGFTYRIEVEFVSNDAGEASGSCTA